MDFGDLTTIIGENNCGKSAFLTALDLFFAAAPRVEDRDFSDMNFEQPIEITIEFANLTPTETHTFAANLIDKHLIVTRVFLIGNPRESGRFFVDAFVNPDFSACRNETTKSEKRNLYSDLPRSVP